MNNGPYTVAPSRGGGRHRINRMNGDAMNNGPYTVAPSRGGGVLAILLICIIGSWGAFYYPIKL
jgi:hypothetical protein